MEVEKWVLKDGRKAEKRVLEQEGDGFSQRVIELHVEEERPLRLQQRVIEKTKPFIFERKTEVVDPKTGNLVEEKVESLDPPIRNDYRSTPFVDNKVTAQSVGNCDCESLKQEIIDAVISVIKTPPTVIKTDDFSNRLKSLGVADEIGKRVSTSNTVDNIFVVIAVIGIIALGYILWFM